MNRLDLPTFARSVIDDSGPVKTRWLSWVGVLALVSGCGGGTLKGTFEGAPFELRHTTVSLGRGRLFIVAQDKVTDCTEHLQSGRLFQILLQFPVAQGLPSLGKYPLSTYSGPTVVPSALPERIVTDELCVSVRNVPAEAGEVELLRLDQDPRSKALEAELKVDLTFAGEQVAGTLLGRSCASTASWYCGAP